MRQRKVKKKKKRIIGVIFAVIAIGISCFALVIQNDKDEEEKESKITYDDLRDKAVKEYEFGTGELTIDWEVLKDCNVVGWIKMGKYIDYPIVQGEDNKYYLRHSYDGSYNGNGSIFMNCNNNSDFMDLNTIIYGHNMKNGSMFGSIHSFEDETFFDGHPYIYVYTENERLTYEIYEAAKFTDVYIPSEYVISSKDDRDQFLADVREKVSDNKLHVREDMEIGEDDRLITLSTCVSGERNHRYLVIGVLVETALYR